MKGIVLQQAVYKGDVVGAEMLPMMMNNPNQTYVFSEKTFNIPQEPLLSTSGYIIEEQKICPAQTIIITTTHLSELPIKQIKKLKVYKKSQMEGYAKLKVQSQTTGKVMLLTAHDCQHFAITCFWMKLNSMNIQNDIKQEFINCCQGDVMKKSEILKVWEPRYLLITCKDGLMSFRDRKDGPTLVVQAIQEFWTRFQFVEGYKYVVFKFWHGIFKYEYAVPSHRAVKWFKAFYSLLTK